MPRRVRINYAGAIYHGLVRCGASSLDRLGGLDRLPLASGVEGGLDSAPMKKADVLKAIVEELQSEFLALKEASEEARGSAADGESRAEGKYDTKSTEAN